MPKELPILLTKMVFLKKEFLLTLYNLEYWIILLKQIRKFLFYIKILSNMKIT